jgi:hypothetical protein
MLEMTSAVALKKPICRSNPGRGTGVMVDGIRSLDLDTFYDVARIRGGHSWSRASPPNRSQPTKYNGRPVFWSSAGGWGRGWATPRSDAWRRWKAGRGPRAMPFTERVRIKVEEACTPDSISTL